MAQPVNQRLKREHQESDMMDDVEAIDARRQAFTAALAAEDIAQLTDLVTDDHVGMPPHRPTTSGRPATQQFWREMFDAATPRITVASEDLHPLGDIAIDRFAWVMTM